LFAEAKTLHRNLPVMNNLSFPSGMSEARYQGAVENPHSGVDGRRSNRNVIPVFLNSKEDYGLTTERKPTL
jgi:hypothetical protein